MDLRQPMLPVDAASPRRWKVAGVLLLAAASLGACGDNAPARAPSPSGPPEWCAARDNLPSEGSAALVRAREACWLRLSIREPDGSVMRGAPYRLAAGAQVRITWSVREKPGGPPRSITPEDKAAGRSEVHNLLVDYAFDTRLVHVYALQRLTRPGRGQALHTSALPPAGFQPLTFEAPAVLCRLAIADWSAGTATRPWARVPSADGSSAKN